MLSLEDNPPLFRLLMSWVKKIIHVLKRDIHLVSFTYLFMYKYPSCSDLFFLTFYQFQLNSFSLLPCVYKFWSKAKVSGFSYLLVLSSVSYIFNPWRLQSFICCLQSVSFITEVFLTVLPIAIKYINDSMWWKMKIIFSN